MRYKKYIEPLWELQKEQIILQQKVNELSEKIYSLKQEIFLYFDEYTLIFQDDWAIEVDPRNNVLEVFTKDEYEKVRSRRENDTKTTPRVKRVGNAEGW